ncbi:cell division protein FtsX [candidate division KSB1 bacterium]
MAGMLFSVKEGIKGFKRARLSSVVSVFSIFLALSALGIFVLFTFKLQAVLEQIEDKVELETYIAENLSQRQIENLKSRIENIKGIREVEFISQKKATERFEKLFGMDIDEFSPNGENPLPVSFIIRVKKEYLNKEYMDALQNTISKYSGITDTVFERKLFLLIEHYRNVFLIADLIGGILIMLGSVFVVSNTIKLTIYSKSKTITIMKLIGASEGFIKRPFLFEGLSQGILGGIISSLFIFILLKTASFLLDYPLSADIKFYAAVVISGALLGFTGSYFSARKFLS